MSGVATAPFSCILRRPRATRRHVARAVNVPERRVARNLDRLVADGLLVLVADGASPALSSYQLPY
ncbi:winged helix-turn-helix domain-containing protein [Streptomyces sp. NPDC012421]|uniref:winged helix-turn-helix domain-containing protein n=1 Tax=Streptomyces sp. NPDC012421 TaxID=3364832 RepID=UPI0036E09CB7